MSGFGFVLNFKWPGVFSDFVTVLDGLNLNLFRVAPFECYFPGTGFFADLVVSTMYPIVLSIILIYLDWYWRARARIHVHVH